MSEPMTVDERRKCLRKMQKRYQIASRGERSRLLDEMEAVLGQHRESLIWHMNGCLKRKPRHRSWAAADDCYGCPRTTRGR